MRIAIVTDIPFLCEDTMYVSELEKRLPSLGIETEVILVNSASHFKAIDASTGIVRFLSATKLLNRLNDFDLIHVQFTYPLGFAFALLSQLRLLKKPLLVHTHGYDIFTESTVAYGLRRSKIGRYLTDFTWGRSKRIVAVCERSKAGIESAGINSSKIDVLYNGVDESLFRRKTSEIQEHLSKLRNENDLILLSVATLVPVKNHQRMIRAFQMFQEKVRSKYKIKLALIGKKQTLNLDHEMASDSDIVYLGKINHENLPAYYSIADAFVLPSLSEAHPWSILEAMSCELPVIASEVGGIPETINSNQLLVDPYQTNDILRKFELIMEIGDKERRKIGSANRSKVLTSFTYSRHLDKLRRIYLTALAS